METKQLIDAEVLKVLKELETEVRNVKPHTPKTEYEYCENVGFEKAIIKAANIIYEFKNKVTK